MLLCNEEGFTGLEAAIVLIAFVVVAAVFSYVVLGAGFYTTQSAQTAVHTSIDQASSSLEVVGDIMGVSLDTDPSRLSYLNTSVALTAGGTAMDLTHMVISYSDNNGGRNISLNLTSAATGTCNSILSGSPATDKDIYWCVSQKMNEVGESNNLLEPNEIWVLSIGMPQTAAVNHVVTINLQPAVGAFLPLTRTVPGGLNKIQALH